MKNRYFWMMLVLIAGTFLFFSSCTFMIGQLAKSVVSMGELQVWNKPHIGLIEIEGPIHTSLTVWNQVETLRSSASISGVLVRVNSPGGAVAASQEINYYLSQFKADGVPVVVSYGDIAASGGYYSTLSADFIFANPGTLTGSIGVIAQFPQVENLMEKIGVDMVTVKTGELKDAGSPFRKVTSKDLAYFNDVLKEAHGQFFEEILLHRKIDRANLQKVADGRVITGQTAWKLGLVDSVGSFLEAGRYLESLTGVEFTKQNIREVKPARSLWQRVLEDPVASTWNRFTARVSGIYYQMP
jgi:protease IV